MLCSQNSTDIHLNSTFCTNPILLDLIVFIIFSEVNKLQSSSLCSFLQPPHTSFFLGPKLSSVHSFHMPLFLCYSLNERNKVSYVQETSNKNIPFLF
jgi:hypothetical protein